MFNKLPKVPNSISILLGISILSFGLMSFNKSEGGTVEKRLEFKEKLESKNSIWKENAPTVTSTCGEGNIIFTKNVSNASVNISKSSSNLSPAKNELFEYTIQYSCVSITEHCDDVVITDVLDGNLNYISSSVSTPGATINVSGNTVTVTFTSGNGSGLDAGSTGQIVIAVSASDNGFYGDLINTADIVSSNGGTKSASTTISLAEPSTDYYYYNAIDIDKWQYGHLKIGAYYEYGISIHNPSPNDLTNVVITDDLPYSFDMYNIWANPADGTNTAYSMFVKSTDNPTTWVHWFDSNSSIGTWRAVSDLGLTSGARVTEIKMEIPNLEGGGSISSR